MVGLTQDRASPHVAILCKEKWFRTQARQVILESGHLQDRGWVGCIGLPFEIRQNGATSPAPKSTVGLPRFQESTISRRDQHNVAISYYPESTSGLRIAISGFDGYVCMATLGGIIEINGALFGLSVSHVFSAQTPSYDGTSSEHESDAESFFLDEDDLDPFVRSTESDKVLDDEETYSRFPKTSDPSDKLTQASETENVGLSPDVEDDVTDPFMDRRRDSESPKWSLGSRVTFNNEAAYDVEWALISQDGDGGPIEYSNSVKTNSGEKLSVNSVANEMATAGTHLLLRAPRGGMTATAIGSESSVQLTSGNRYLRLWTVRVDHAGEGDCGSWIVNQETGELFGMLVATCEAVCEAYILPIKDVFTEIKTFSGYSAGLPVLYPITGSSETKTSSLGDFEVMKDSISDSATDLNVLYWPLQAHNFRVLKLLPDVPGAVIHCELSVRSLGGAADYEGLCYALGAPKSTSHIIVHGQSISVDSMLASALDDLRYIDRPRFLWVDTLCINPENVEERNSQVSLLAPILLEARGVCIWLGPGTSESHLAFLNYDAMFAMNKEVSKTFLKSADILCDLFARAWYHRGAVQAICLARYATTHCGRDFIPWKAFMDTVSALVSDPFVMSHQSKRRHFNVILLSEFVYSIENSIRWLDDGQIQRKYSLEYLVMTCSWLDTTSAHDSIYSMLSLASDVYPLPKSSVTSRAKDFFHEPPPLKAVDELNITPVMPKTGESFRMPLEGRQKRPLIVDYSQSFEHVCKDFVQLAIQNSQSLDILCTPWAPEFDRLPSWVPARFNASTVENQDDKPRRLVGKCFVSNRRGAGIIQTYDASGIKLPIVLISNDTYGAPVLSVEGFTIDYVQAKTSPALMGNFPLDWLEFLGWKDISEPPPDKAWRTLVGDRGPDNRFFPPASYQRACGRMFRQMKVEGGPILTHSDYSEDRTIQGFAQTAQATVWDRRLIRTGKHSFLGLAPQATQHQDIVAILYGLSVPVVLRRIHGTRDGDNVFILVGECFIYGMMDGEALKFKEVHGIQDQTFVLR